MSRLIVDFAGDRRVVERRLTFGRAADLELDANPHLHRLVGEFVQLDDQWWLQNLGTRLFITLVDRSGTRVDLAPGGRQLITTSNGSVRVSVGQARYELGFEVQGAVTAPEPSAPSADGATTDFQAILTPRELDFLVTFARPVLDGTNGPLPTYVEVAELWGVSPKTLDNTVQSIKRKMRNARLVRDEPLDTLVRVAISHSLVTTSDLEWAAIGDGGPRSSAAGPRFATPG